MRSRGASSLGPGSVAIGGSNYGQIVTNIRYGPGPIPLAVARLDPRQVFADVDLDHFTGRDWLAAEVDDFMSRHECGYIFIKAKAGLGKTAFAAWLARERGYVSHFSRTADSPEAA